MAPTPAASHAQIEALLDFMREHQVLARGLLRGADGRVRSKRLWESLCNSLNSLGSCTKSVEQWQRVWSDKKHLAKKAAGAARRSAYATGGGPSEAPTLSQVEIKILAIMGEGFGEPQTQARVPAFPSGPPVVEPVARSPPHTATPADPLSQQQPSTSTEALEAELPIMENQHTLNPRLRRGRSRRGRRCTGDSARSRIVEVEEQRLVIETRKYEALVQIKDAMLELCTLIREHVTRNT